MRTQARGELQRRRPPGKIVQQVLKLRLKSRIGLRQLIGPLQLKQRHHQRFGNVAAAIRTEASRNNGRIDDLRAHECADGPSAFRSFVRAGSLNSRLARSTSAKNSRILPRSFFPGRDSTPLATSTAYGRTERIASATFSGVRPPAKIIGRATAARRAKAQSIVCPVPPYWPARAASSKNPETPRNLASSDSEKPAATRKALMTGILFAQNAA